MSITFKSTVTKVGFSLRTVIPVEICRALGLQPGDVLAVRLEERKIIFEPERKRRKR